jgi:hypothetical protein
MDHAHFFRFCGRKEERKDGRKQLDVALKFDVSKFEIQFL